VRNVVVTGGSRGLGLGIAQALAASGFRVVAVARKPTEQLQAAMQQAAQGGAGALHFHSFDLAETDGIAGLVKSLRSAFGPLYGLVNNAARGDAGLLSTMSDALIARQVALNVVAPATLTKHVVRSMMTSAGITGEGGRIVNLASVVASTGYSGLSVYSATKAALLGFTRSLARELGPLGITVNAVAPGFVDTEMTHDLTPPQRAQIVRRSALRRMPEAGDVAAAVNFLFSEGARNITGTVMTVDAGNTA
jgi:3-oxoacyl-[acyl-carrier protein] reductase